MFEYGTERNRKIILTGFCPICGLDYRIDWFNMDNHLFICIVQNVSII